MGWIGFIISHRYYFIFKHTIDSHFKGDMTTFVHTS